MRELATDLWVAERSLRFGGTEIGARMTVLRVSDDRLFVHSPIPLSDGLLAQVSGLGSVSWIIAPNRLHHLSVSEWRDEFPGAQLFVPPGIEKKRPDLVDATILGEDDPFSAEGIESEAVQGVPFANETVFFHRASSSLILSDLAFNIGAEAPWLTRVMFRLNGGYGRLGPTVIEKLLIRDKAAFAQSLQRIFAWPFERVVVAHGAVKEAGTKSWLPTTPGR